MKKTSKPSPGPALIKSMKELLVALKEGNVDKFNQSWVRPKTGTRVSIKGKQ